MRRLIRSKRGAGEEAVRTLPYTALAGILVLFTIGLMVRWFWMLFIAGPSIWDGYGISNFDRLGEEVGTMLETGKWHEARVTPYTLFTQERGGDDKRTLVGIVPGMPLPESSGCNDPGEIQINKICKKYPCLCLCDGRDCTDKNQCKVFKKSKYGNDVRFVGLDQENFNVGDEIPDTPDPLGQDTFYELVLIPYCTVWNKGTGWGSMDTTGNLYIEETRSDDGKYVNLLIAREDDITEKRKEKITELGRKEECNEEGATGTGICYDLNCCGECKTSNFAPAEVYCECMPRGTKGGFEAHCEDLDCCDDCEYDGDGMFPECVRISTASTGGGTWREVCGIENPVKGIDISYHQSVIDWNKVANDGIEFAFIRASVATGSSIHGDTQFSNNWKGAKANGIKRGAYHFFRADKNAEIQADVFLDQLGSDYGEFPPIIDVEMDSVTPYPFVREDWINGIDTWIDIVESKTGMKPIIYTGPGFWSGINTDRFSDHTLWVAHWTEGGCPDVPSAWGDWVFWQWCGGCLGVDGIGSDVDANVFNGDMNQLMAYVQQARVI